MWHAQGYVLHKQLVEVPPLPTLPDSNFGGLAFPTLTTLDRLTLHPKILAVAREYLKGEVLLSQSEAWQKTSDLDQRMHMDYGNHSFLYPTPWDQPEVVAAIVYLDDTRVTGGATRVVPWQPKLYDHVWDCMPGIGFPFHNARKYDHYEHPLRKELYAHEVEIHAQPGDVLFYRHDLWHRGTPVRPGHRRRVLNLVFKQPHAHHIYTWGQGYARKNYHGGVERLVATLTHDQRAALGIPRHTTRCRL